MIPDLLSAFPHRQFHTLPGLLDSWAALPNSYPNACMPMQGGSLYHFYDGLWYDSAERRTHDLPCERRTRYRLSQPDTVEILHMGDHVVPLVKAWYKLTWRFAHKHLFLRYLSQGFPLYICRLWNTISCIFACCIVLKWSGKKISEACDCVGLVRISQINCDLMHLV